MKNRLEGPGAAESNTEDSLHHSSIMRLETEGPMDTVLKV